MRMAVKYWVAKLANQINASHKPIAKATKSIILLRLIPTSNSRILMGESYLLVWRYRRYFRRIWRNVEIMFSP